MLSALTEALAHCTTRQALERKATATLAGLIGTSELLLDWHSPDKTQLTAAALTAPWHDATLQLVVAAQRHCLRLERVALLSQSAHRASQQLRRELDTRDSPDLIARSEAMRAVLSQARLVAPHDTPVLIRGESGVGKELVADHVHRHSPRAKILKLNCGALPETLIESELFGHEQGAFTGATRTHRGRFERADEGTLLLDEVAELSLPAQVKLLRVLQEGEFERLGSEETLQVDVRVIAATHRDLEQMVRAGQFRQDLYYRLNVFPIEIPPLRERPDDVLALADAMLCRLADQLGRPTPQLTPALKTQLLERPWPGNARELANVLERAMILSAGGPLTLPPLGAAATLERPQTFDEAARSCIERALTACDGRVYGDRGAATALGLNPSTLQSKMKKLGIRRETFT